MEYLTTDDPRFPKAFTQVHAPPEGVYYEGNVAALSLTLLAVVGTRRMSAYAAAVLRLLLPPLVRAGVVIVSGLAYGVDAEAHRVTLEHGGMCVGVLGSPLDAVYPARHIGLVREIVQKDGLVISEYPPGSAPWKSNFPARNRLIAALAPVVLVVEAAERSGTFSTVRAALELGREVCVVPSDITRQNNEGVLRLLKEGARPITCSEDLAALYQLPLVASEPVKPALTGSLATLYACISQGASHPDDLVHQTGWPINVVQSLLSTLEFDGYISYRQSAWHITS